MTSVIDESTRFTILHALAIRGMIVESLAAQVTRLPGPDALYALEALTADGSASFNQARRAWRVTAAGRQRHRELLDADMDGDTRARLRPHYDAFLPLNTRFKTLCTSWQTRDGAPNDHTDTGYDDRVVTELGQVHDTISPLVEKMAALRLRFAGYGERFTDAVTRVRAGERTAFTGVFTDSYHDVWMDLHRDLLLSLGIERSTRDG